MATMSAACGGRDLRRDHRRPLAGALPQRPDRRIIIALGHFTLAFHALPFFYAGLSLIVIGTGLLKPNVSTLVGSLYEQGTNGATPDSRFSTWGSISARSSTAHRRQASRGGRLAPGLRVCRCGHVAGPGAIRGRAPAARPGDRASRGPATQSRPPVPHRMRHTRPRT